MSTDTKYQVMGELLGIHAAAIEMAEEQAGRIIEMVKGEGRFAPTVKDVYWPNMAGPASGQLLEEPASVKVQATKPKHHPIQTEESKAITAKVVSLRKDGLSYREIAKWLGITNDAARNRYEKWQKKQKEFCGIPKDEPKNDTEQISSQEIYEPGADEARREADLAEATIRKSLTVDEFIQERIAAGDLDIEILQAVKRNFPGVSMNVADIRSRR